MYAKFYLYNIKHLWYRKGENTFEIISNDLGETLQKVNGIDEKLEFPLEKAMEGNLPFLDCIINLNGKIQIITKVYKKPTRSGEYTHYSSNQPLHVNL